MQSEALWVAEHTSKGHLDHYFAKVLDCGSCEEIQGSTQPVKVIPLIWCKLGLDKRLLLTNSAALLLVEQLWHGWLTTTYQEQQWQTGNRNIL